MISDVVAAAGIAHVPRARNFTIENKFSSEGFLAECHRHSSPGDLYSVAEPVLLMKTGPSDNYKSCLRALVAAAGIEPATSGL